LADLAILPFPPNGHGKLFWYVPTFLLQNILDTMVNPMAFNNSSGFWNQHLGDFVFDIVLSESAIDIGLKDN